MPSPSALPHLRPPLPPPDIQWATHKTFVSHNSERSEMFQKPNPHNNTQHRPPDRCILRPRDPDRAIPNQHNSVAGRSKLQWDSCLERVYKPPYTDGA